ncbi:MAG: FAD-binding protein [Gemmatimonadota bacterium]|nr:FAD-binding protein [Gemmatimonadota bacterium]
MTTVLRPTWSTGAPSPRDDLRRALEMIVGRVHVSIDERALDDASRSTVPQSTRPALLVRPASRDEVVAVVRVVARHGGTVYPISGGRNWGYSDACAPADGAVLLDLSRMQNIIEVNAPLAYAVIEPGVTQRQLGDFLRDNTVRLRLEATGAGPDATLTGNMLERGIGYGAYGDRGAEMCALEVVLADGSVLNTGPGAYPGAAAEHVRGTAIGPELDGLFRQSGWGIVTRLTVWLEPEPVSSSYLFFTLEKPESIGMLVDALRTARLSGSLPGVVHLYNDMRLLGATMRRPATDDDGAPLARHAALEVAYPKLTRRLLAQHGLPAWTGSAVLNGSSRAEVAAKRRAIKRVLRRVDGLRAVFISDALVRRGAWLRARTPAWVSLAKLRATWDRLWLGVSMLRGEPIYETLRGAMWRTKGDVESSAAPRDPIEARAGIAWVAPILPAASSAVHEVDDIARAVLHAHGFEYQVTFSLVSPRAVAAVISICFDRANTAECARAAACHDALVRALLERGYPPYRGSHRARELAREAAPAFWAVADRVRAALDPSQAISRGR